MTLRTPFAVGLAALIVVQTGCGSSEPAPGDVATPPLVVATTTEPDTVATPTTEPAEVTPPTRPDEPQAPSTSPPSTSPPSTSPPSTSPPTVLPVSPDPTAPSPARPTNIEVVTIDDGTFDSVAEMAASSSLVVVGDVVGISSLGRPFVDRDPNANEFVAITVTTVETIQGERIGEIVLAWEAFAVDTDGDRTATLVTNGVPPPVAGDRVVLFLDSADEAFADVLDGTPTHRLVRLDGIAWVTGDRIVAAEVGSTAADQLLTMTLADLRAALDS